MADVLEDMPFPKAGLAAARRLLRPDGVLFPRCRTRTTWLGGGTPTASNPIGARSSIITIFPASGFMRYCKTRALSRSALPRLHGGDRDQGMRGGSLPVADQHLPESRETSSGEHAAARRPFSFFRFLGESHPAGCDPAHPASPCRFQTSMLFLTNRMLAVICV
jgi:hypothetical protein